MYIGKNEEKFIKNTEEERLVPVSFNDNEGEMQYFVDKGIEMQINYLTAMGVAAYDGNIAGVKFLMEQDKDKKGADILNKNKSRALSYACEQGNEEIVKLLLEYGVDIHLNNNEAIDKAMASSNSNIKKMLISLIEKEEMDDGISINFLENFSEEINGSEPEKSTQRVFFGAQ